MKNIILTLLTLLTLTAYSQKVDCVKYPLHSDIWEFVCDKSMGIMIIPTVYWSGLRVSLPCLVLIVYFKITDAR